MKLLCDQMLGSLARWLRICGFDTMFPSGDPTDEEILRLASQDQRVLISRDKLLLQRAHKAGIHCIGLSTTNLTEQISQVLSFLPLDKSQVLSRCLICNTMLEPVEKNRAKAGVPLKVFETKEEFWFCLVCNKYYWKGTHYENMMQQLKSYERKMVPP